MENKSTTHVLTFAKATKGSLVYSSEVFPGFYIPKHVVEALSPGQVPTHIKMTLEVE